MDSNILTDVSTESLVTAIRANLCEFFRHVTRNNPADHYENEKFARWYTALPHPWFNGVLCSNPPAPADEAFIDETIKYFRDKGIGTFTWWLEPHLKRSDWESALSSRGLGFSDGTPGMAIDLNELDESAQPMQGLDIRIVEDDKAMQTWAKVFAPGYDLPPEWADMILDAYQRLGLDLPVRNYLGYMNGEPVATSSLFLGGGAAGIYSVATLPPQRGQGLGTALTLKPLLDARAMGYRIGVLQSSEMGYNVYKKLGFKHLCQIENYYFAH